MLLPFWRITLSRSTHYPINLQFQRQDLRQNKMRSIRILFLCMYKNENVQAPKVNVRVMICLELAAGVLNNFHETEIETNSKNAKRNQTKRRSHSIRADSNWLAHTVSVTGTRIFAAFSGKTQHFRFFFYFTVRNCHRYFGSVDELTWIVIVLMIDLIL